MAADNTVKLKLDAGFYKNGTEYQAAGRWLDGDLVRWHQGHIQPINGWQAKVNFGTMAALPALWAGDTEAARSGIVLGEVLGGVSTFIGTNKKIYHLSNSNAITDVTPTGFVAKEEDAAANTGYGSFLYGFGSYGTPRPATNAGVAMVFSWGFTAWGDWPIAVARSDDALELHVKRSTDADFVAIAGSPAGANDVLVTDERIVMTFGAPDDGKLIQWSDQEDFDMWAPAIDNQAGSLRVSGTGRLVRGVKVINQILVIGDNDVFSGQYLGPPHIYGFNRVGNNCGIIGPNAVVVNEAFAAWLGNSSFWVFDGSVKQLYCEVLDYILDDMNMTQRSKVNAFNNSAFSECWWLYQSKASVTNEVDSYVIYNFSLDRWYTGRLNRTMGLDKDPSSNVLMVSNSGLLYDHEIKNASRGSRIPYIETGPLELANGERLLGVSYVFPDAKTVGDVRMQLQVRDMPNDLEAGVSAIMYSRDFELLRPTSTHGIMGRDIRMRLYGSGISAQWVIGDFRVVPIKGASPGR